MQKTNPDVTELSRAKAQRRKEDNHFCGFFAHSGKSMEDEVGGNRMHPFLRILPWRLGVFARELLSDQG
jgi:hypothetical protein